MLINQAQVSNNNIFHLRILQLLAFSEYHMKKGLVVVKTIHVSHIIPLKEGFLVTFSVSGVSKSELVELEESPPSGLPP